MPYPFWDNKRQIFEWVYNHETIGNKRLFDVSTLLDDVIGGCANSGLTYYYEVKHKVTHCHSFDELLKALYNYPESFNIPDEYKEVTRN